MNKNLTIDFSQFSQTPVLQKVKVPIVHSNCLNIYGCFLKWWYPQIIHLNRVFHYKPSIFGYPYFWKHPYWHLMLEGMVPDESFSFLGLQNLITHLRKKSRIRSSQGVKVLVGNGRFRLTKKMTNGITSIL